MNLRNNAVQQLPTLYGLPRLINADNSSSPPSSPRFASASSFNLGIPAGSGSGSGSSLRSLSPSPSLSLRAPPLSRRNSASSLNGDGSSAGGTAMRRARTHTGIRSAQPSPTLLQAPMDTSRIFVNAAAAGPSVPPRLGGPASTSPSLPTIAQSPERKKTRRYEEGEDDTDTEVDEADDDADPLI